MYLNSADTDDIEIPNLDCMDSGALIELADVFSSLAKYARLRAASQSMRANGMISSAFARERKQDEIYRSLPSWAKW